MNDARTLRLTDVVVRPNTVAMERMAVERISWSVWHAVFHATGPPHQPTRRGVSAGYEVHQTGNGIGDNDCTNDMARKSSPSCAPENRESVQNGSSNLNTTRITPPIARP